MTPPAPAAGSGAPLADGDVALLVDAQGRHYLLKLGQHRAFHSHIGFLRHEDIIGKAEGTRLVTSQGKELLLFRPRLSDFVLLMQRPTQIVYPKDAGAILTVADIFPGAVVLEAGTGSGALTLSLLRGVGSQGRVISYEVRPDLAELALNNIRQFLGQVPDNLTLNVKDVCQGVEAEVDRAILDLPQPWLALPAVAGVLRPGGVLLAYLPTVLQVHRLVETLRQNQAFDRIETMEVWLRTWHVGGVSVRPDHRMVAHTGFITTARKLAPRVSDSQAGDATFEPTQHAL